jgi:hypothetical protein
MTHRRFYRRATGGFTAEPQSHKVNVTVIFGNEYILIVFYNQDGI